MTIYLPKVRRLPAPEMAGLCPDARFSETKKGKATTAYAYAWPDLTITINLMPEAEIPEHLEGFVGYAENVARANGAALDPKLAKRIRATTMVLGFVVSDTEDDSVWRERIEHMIGMLCYNLDGLLFWEGLILDENCEQLLPPK